MSLNKKITEETILREIEETVKEIKRTVKKSHCSVDLANFTDMLSYYHCLREVSRSLNNLHSEYENCLIEASTQEQVFECVERIKTDMVNSTKKMVETLDQCQSNLKCNGDGVVEQHSLVNCLTNAKTHRAVKKCLDSKYHS